MASLPTHVALPQQAAVNHLNRDPLPPPCCIVTHRSVIISMPDQTTSVQFDRGIQVVRAMILPPTGSLPLVDKGSLTVISLQRLSIVLSARKTYGERRSVHFNECFPPLDKRPTDKEMDVPTLQFMRGQKTQQ